MNPKLMDLFVIKSNLELSLLGFFFIVILYFARASVFHLHLLSTTISSFIALDHWCD